MAFRGFAIVVAVIAAVVIAVARDGVTGSAARARLCRMSRALDPEEITRQLGAAVRLDR